MPVVLRRVSAHLPFDVLRQHGCCRPSIAFLGHFLLDSCRFMRRFYPFRFLLLLVMLAPLQASQKLLEENQKILFLGDSITQSGHYVAYFDAWLVAHFPNKRFTVINAGLASETVSGLSEEDHAGGRFPRPDLFERLERVLAKTQPDLILACYGMNCGIYQELDEERFAHFREGMQRLRDAAQQHGAELVHITPPIYDNQGAAGFDYDEVLTAYSEWLVAQREAGWHVADLHSEMRAKINAAKADDPEFTVQKDRIHPNKTGHWMMAQSLICYFGDPGSAALATPEALIDRSRLAAIKLRMQGYLKAIHAETKPLRPGAPQGALESAAERAAELEAKIYGE